MRIIVAFLILFILIACEDNFVPKPRAYYRIEFPEKEYNTFNSPCPYEFEYPQYSVIEPDMKGDEAVCWWNVRYVPFNARLHLSYKPIVKEGDLQHLITDAYTFVQKHNMLAESIEEEFVRNENDGFGIIYKIGGNTASSVQFFMTDSTQHFLRGSLYFMAKPNKDSLAPVVDFLETDVKRLMGSLKWKDQELEKYR